MTALAKTRVVAYLQGRDKPATRGQIRYYGATSNGVSTDSLQAFLDELVRTRKVKTETVTHTCGGIKASVGYRWVGKRKAVTS